jgi:hypothetical protein
LCSQLRSERESITKEEIVTWLRSRIEELESELKVMKSMLELLEGGESWRPGEKPEEVKVGRRKIAVLYRGEYYVRIVPQYPMPDVPEIRGYLENILNEIKEIQVRSGAESGDELARLTIRTGPEGHITEIIFENLFSAVEILKAKAALKHSVEVGWHIYRAREKETE